MAAKLAPVRKTGGGYPQFGASESGLNQIHARRFFLSFVLGLTLPGMAANDLRMVPGREYLGVQTNGPAIQKVYRDLPTATSITNSRGMVIKRPVSRRPEAITTNRVFISFIPESLNHLIWTNFVASTNGRTTRIWAERRRTEKWPEEPPVMRWDTNGLMWVMKGLTALSPAWQNEGDPGQVPITALTRRHGYTRGHSLGPEGFRTLFKGKKVWFLDKKNQPVEITIAREVVRNGHPSAPRDYCLVLFSRDLPTKIETVRVMSHSTLLRAYPDVSAAPHPIFCTEQTGYVSAGVPGWAVEMGKPGDSGCPNLLPLPGELIFVGGRTTSGPSKEMQEDMDDLCRQEGLNPKAYPLRWFDTGRFPVY